MKKTLTLDSAIKINGKDVTELTHDAQEITAGQFTEACARSASIDKTKSFSFKLRENDYALHFYLGIMAIIAVNPEIAVEDMERVKGFDSLKIADIGMLFTLRRSGEASKENNSDEQSETTPNTSARAQSNSKEND